jgi:hypothetical protein
MTYPDHKDYGPFYDDDGKPTAEYGRYADAITRYHEEESKVGHLLADLSVGGIGPGLDREMVFRLLGEQLHRTEQQNLGRNIRVLLEAVAQLETDDRNEATVRFAATALDATKGIALPFI